MQFQNPTFLWALGVLAIPIIIHLFNLRRHKTVYFSDVKFLKEAQQSTKKQRRLKEWLILFSRMMVFTAIVLAFAKPFLPTDDRISNSNKAILVIDNSASTAVGNTDISPFENAKKIAIEVVNQFPNSMEIAIRHASSKSTYQFQSKQNTLDEIKRLNVVDRPLNFQPNTEPGDATTYFISDLQKNELEFLNEKNDSSEWIIIPSIDEGDENFSMANIAIDSVWVETPFLIAGQSVDIFIKIKNHSAETVETNLEILVNNLPEITLSESVNANEDQVIQASLSQMKTGYNNVQINILNDAVSFDNRHLLSYYLPFSNHVVEIYENESSNLINKIFTGDEFTFQALSLSSLEFETLTNADLIILNELENINSGLINSLTNLSRTANLFIIPKEGTTQALNGLCEKLGVPSFGILDTSTLRTQTINTEDPFFEEVFSGSLENTYWPTVKSHYNLGKESRLPSFSLMTLANGDPLFLRTARSATNVFQLALPLNPSFSDLATHPVVVPMFIKALLKKDNISSLTGTVGEESKFSLIIKPTKSDAPVELQGLNQDFIPRQQLANANLNLLLGAELERSGTYKVVKENEVIGEISFNVPKKESDLQRFEVDELKNLTSELDLKNIHFLSGNEKNIKANLREWQQGIQLWKYCLLVALIFIFVEVVLLRFLK